MRIDIETGEGDNELAARLDSEIYAHNAETTGLRDGRLLTVRAATRGVVVAGLSGWTWGACGFILRGCWSMFATAAGGVLSRGRVRRAAPTAESARGEAK